MQYVGSKRRFAKEIVPIIQKCIDENGVKNYLEPFCGGGNIIDKVRCDRKIGSDIHKQLIALLKQAQTDVSVFPETVSEDEYKRVRDNKENYPDWYVGLCGFCGSFGTLYFTGYARDPKGGRDKVNERIRAVIKQAPNLKGIEFICQDFLDIKNISGYVIYCDPPYKGTTNAYKTNKFPHERFYDWCREMSKNNIVLISEYEMPEDFKIIWEKKTNTQLMGNGNGDRVERLYILK